MTSRRVALACISAALGVPAADLRDDTPLDSLARLAVWAALVDELDLDVGDAAMGWGTVGDAVDAVERMVRR